MSGVERVMTKQEEEDRVREWEEGLPSLADLISLSQCLISPQLASAFSITSPSPPPPRSPADVALASHSAFSSLRRASHTYPDILGKINPHPQPPAGDHTPSCGVEDPQLNAGDHMLHGLDLSHPQLCAGDRSPHGAHVSERIYDGNLKSIHGVHSDEIHLADFTPLATKERSHGGGVSVREWHGNSNTRHLRSHGGDASLGKYHGSSTPLDGYGGGDLKASETDGDGDGDGEGEGEGTNAGPSISDSSDVATQADGGNEAEEAESTHSAAENSNAETMVRTLKRPRLVWTPELHKRFVDAVSHLGVKTAVPKTIMQLMNVEGLTRENVASHLQKYRLYLKRMQGLSNEGPTSSDVLFASAPVPAGLATPVSFHASMPAHLQDINQVPFVPSHNPVSMGRGHVAGIMSGPLPPMDPFSLNIFARPPSHRFVQGDVRDVQGFRQHQSASSQHVPKM